MAFSTEEWLQVFAEKFLGLKFLPVLCVCVCGLLKFVNVKICKNVISVKAENIF